MSVIEFPPCAGSAGVKSTLAGAVVAVPLSSWMRLRFSHWLLACSSLRSSSIRLLMDFWRIPRKWDGTNVKLAKNGAIWCAIFCYLQRNDGRVRGFVEGCDAAKEVPRRAGGGQSLYGRTHFSEIGALITLAYQNGQSSLFCKCNTPALQYLSSFPCALKTSERIYNKFIKCRKPLQPLLCNMHNVHVSFFSYGLWTTFLVRRVFRWCYRWMIYNNFFYYISFCYVLHFTTVL